MIVDDEPVTTKVVRRYLREAGYRDFLLSNDATAAMATVRSDRPDVVLLDLLMPGKSGLEILGEIRADHEFEAVPVIILTATDDQHLKRTALEMGATDFLYKPVDPIDLVPRVRNSLAVKIYQDRLREHANQLEQQVRERTAELEASRLEVIYCLGRAAEYRDNETGRHVIRVGRYVGMVARALGLEDQTASLLEQAAPLHDMGKIGIPDEILLKPGRLEPHEFELMKKHTEYGCNIVSTMGNDEWAAFTTHTSSGVTPSTRSPVLETAATIALTHHEKWDGSGYPRGLRGEEIPLEGRITAVADVFDALSSKRPYKPALPLAQCWNIMEEGRGKHFDPRVLDAFFACEEEILHVRTQYADDP
jgi:putative two-component system response regulator